MSPNVADTPFTVRFWNDESDNTTARDRQDLLSLDEYF